MRKFTVARLLILSLVVIMSPFTAFSKDKDVTFLENGMSCQLAQGILKVEFVTSDIVRVQYAKENVLTGNNTGVCVPRVTQAVRLASKRETDSCLLNRIV